MTIIKQLRNASDDDLIDAHDHAARYVSPGSMNSAAATQLEQCAPAMS